MKTCIWCYGNGGDDGKSCPNCGELRRPVPIPEAHARAARRFDKLFVPVPMTEEERNLPDPDYFESRSPDGDGPDGVGALNRVSDSTETPVTETVEHGLRENGVGRLYAQAGSEPADSLPLVAPAGVPEPTERPQRWSGLLVLNAYGRECYEAGQKAAVGRLPALDALIVKWEADRQKHLETNERLENLGEEPRALKHMGWVYGLEQCMGELRAVLAGLRADPAPRQLIEEKDDTCSRVETGATIPSTGSTAKNHGEG